MREEDRTSLLVDARGIEHSGIGRYLREVLARLFVDHRFGEFLLLGPTEVLNRFVRGRAGSARVRVLPFDHGFYSPRAQLHWAALSARGELNADVVFFPHYDVPVWPVSAPTVVMVHDLTHFRLVGQFPGWKRRVARLVLRRAVRRAAQVIVPSRSTAADLLEREPAVASRLSVIYEGVGDEFGGADRKEEGREPSRYLLCVGNRKPHKNHVAAVEVLARLRPEFPQLRAVLVGRRFPGEDDGVASRAAELRVEDAVVTRTDVSDVELRALYAGAECLLFPSFYEGFGLPVLEAMASGTPVVASDRTAMPEVVGDAGLLFDPLDVDGMSASVRRLLADGAFREEMVKRGRAQAARFSWETTGRQTAEVLLQSAARPGGGR